MFEYLILEDIDYLTDLFLDWHVVSNRFELWKKKLCWKLRVVQRSMLMELTYDREFGHF
jgi:hypothetical protein